MSETGFESRSTTVRDFLSVVFRRKAIILTVLLAAILSVILLNMTTPATYSSTARMLVNRGEPESVFNTRTKLLSWEEELNSEMEVIASSTIAERAQRFINEAKAVNSKGEPIKVDPMKISTTTTGKASVLIVTYRTGDPIEAREALRAVIRSYMEWRAQERSLPIVDGFFQEELESLRDQLSQWEQRRAEFMTAERIVSIPSERESLLRQREGVASQLTAARTRLADYAARLEAVETLQQERRLDPDVEIFGMGDADFDDEGLLFNLRKELNTRRADYYQVRGRYTDDHPNVKAAKELVDDLEGQLDRETENYGRFLDARISVAQARVNSLAASLARIDEMLNSLPDKEARLSDYDRIIAALRTDHETLVERQVAAKVESTGRPEWRVILLQPASPSERERTRDFVRMALVPLFALLIGLALAFVLDGYDHSIKDAAEAEAHLKVPVLGSVSKLR